MSANYEIQKPYVLAELPRPLASASSRSYVIGEVYGHHPSHGKRRRPEVVVGIDGEAANLYDVSASRLITSYPIPPQRSFTCPPISLRIRLPKSQGIARYTYIATRDTTGQTITLFKDVVDGAGKTTSTSKSRHLKTPSPVRYIGVSPSLACSAESSDSQLAGNVVVVCANGDLLSLDPDTLGQRWKESASKLARDEDSTPVSEYNVESVVMTSASEVIEGMFDGRPDIFSAAFPQQGSVKDVNPDAIVLVSHLVRNDAKERQLSILGIPPASDGDGSLQRVLQLHVTPIPLPPQSSPDTQSHYKLHLQSGSLLELRDDNLVVYDVTTAISTVRHKLHMEGTTSFLRLSGHSVLASSKTHLNIYNPAFHSLQAAVPLDLSALAATPSAAGKQTESPLRLSSYFRRLDIAVGIHDNLLVGVQIQPPRAAGKRSHADGLLIDSIGKGTPRDASAPTTTSRPAKRLRSEALAEFLPGSIASPGYMAAIAQETEQADALLAKGDLRGFEEFVADKFQVELDEQGDDAAEEKDDAEGEKSLPEWVFFSSPAEYPMVDRRWVLYAISRCLTLNPEAEEADGVLRLSLASSSIFVYLVVAGHLTPGNLRAAFRQARAGPEVADRLLAESVVLRLAEVDPTLELLVSYVQATKLGATELLMATRAIMRSLDYVQDPFRVQAPKLLLTHGAQGEDNNEDGEGGAEVEDEQIRRELERLDRQLRATEHHLGDESGTRAAGLTAALSKLAAQSAPAVVRTLRACLGAEEIFSLIFVLRGELVRGAWTSKYVDSPLPLSTTMEGGEEGAPDDSICLIAGLLSRCIDAVGLGGWLLNDAMASLGSGSGDDEEDGAGDFLRALRLEVSAALEGLEEAVQLNGVLGEVVRYGYAVRESGGANKAAAVAAEGGSMLPIGLKVAKGVAKEKVVGGGEVMRRTTREIGHLVSQRVEAYSVDRIAL